MKIIVGLGNPTPKYRNNYHNLGFMTADALAEKLKTQGFAEESAFLSHGLENCLRVLDEAESLAASSVMRAEEFSALLSESFTSLKISLIPQTVDAVFVGERCKIAAGTDGILYAAGTVERDDAGRGDLAAHIDGNLIFFRNGSRCVSRFVKCDFLFSRVIVKYAAAGDKGDKQ